MCLNVVHISHSLLISVKLQSIIYCKWIGVSSETILFSRQYSLFYKIQPKSLQDRSTQHEQQHKQQPTASRSRMHVGNIERKRIYKSAITTLKSNATHHLFGNKGGIGRKGMEMENNSKQDIFVMKYVYKCIIPCLIWRIFRCALGRLNLSLMFQFVFVGQYRWGS